MARPRIVEAQKCICSRPRTSGRVYFGYHACLYCGLFITVLRDTVKAFRRVA